MAAKSTIARKLLRILHPQGFLSRPGHVTNPQLAEEHSPLRKNQFTDGKHAAEVFEPSEQVSVRNQFDAQQAELDLRHLIYLNRNLLP